MHPILGDSLRLRLYLTAWALAGAMLALMLRVLLDVPWPSALVFGIPLGMLAAPVSLSAWYLCRAMPLSRTTAARIAVTSLGGAIVTASLWSLAGRVWWQLLDRTGFQMPEGELTRAFTLLVGLGVLGYLLSVTVQYVMQASEDSAAASRRALELQIAHREAELRALRAQVDPHFLFNSLNSIVGLMAADRDRARDMCLRLAEFLRDSLTLGGARSIPLGREVELAEEYLRVEQVRFGSRLSIETVVEPSVADVPVPPLIIQPLVENAVRHGVSTTLEGGTVRVDARRAGSRVFVTVSNPCDPDGRRRGTGFGQDIVRRRLAAAFGDDAALAVEERDGEYRAAVTIPIRDGAGRSLVSQEAARS